MFNFGRKKANPLEKRGEVTPDRQNLQDHEVKCWNCGTVNVKSNLFCTHCDRRLKHQDGEHHDGGE